MAFPCKILFQIEYRFAYSAVQNMFNAKPDLVLTIEKAVSVVQAGETIYIRGGTYNLTTTITIAKSGADGSLISLFAIPGELTVLDFSGQALDRNNRGIKLTGSYWHIKGIHITGAGDNGMKIEGGSYNIIENCAFYRNRDSGLQTDDLTFRRLYQ